MDREYFSNFNIEEFKKSINNISNTFQGVFVKFYPKEKNVEIVFDKEKSDVNSISFLLLMALCSLIPKVAKYNEKNEKVIKNTFHNFIDNNNFNEINNMKL